MNLRIVRPAEIEIANPDAGLEVKAGESTELKGKVVRRGTFKEEVTITLKGLPAGLKAEPSKLAPDQSEFSVKVEADPKASAAEVKAEAIITLQVAKKETAMPAMGLKVKVLAGSGS